MSNLLNTFSRLVLYALFPNKCVFCDKIIGLYGYCCEKCSVRLPFVRGETCPVCGHEKCVCADHEASFDKIISPFFYLEPVRGSVHRFKFRNARGYAKAYAEYIYKKLDSPQGFNDFDVISFIPLIKRDRSRRGYNQAELIAKELASLLNLPVKPLLSKVRRTKKQHDLNAEERKQNLAGAFEIISAEDVSGKKIILCDDVVTTGSTFDEAAKMLKAAGAESVTCCAVASAYCTNGDFMAK